MDQPFPVSRAGRHREHLEAGILQHTRSEQYQDRRGVDLAIKIGAGAQTSLAGYVRQWRPIGWHCSCLDRTFGMVETMITGLAHTGVCVPDCEAAVAFYRDVLGLRVLSEPYVMAGDTIRDDMGELVSDPTMKAAIVGFGDDSDRVLEVIEYLGVAGTDQRTAAAITDHGLSHVGLICEDLDATRAQLEAKGVHFLVDGIADVARVRTTWFVDPWGVVFILVEKSRPERPYFAQWD